MGGTIEHNIRTIIAGDGTIQMNVWSTKDGRFQANVKERSVDGWTTCTEDDPMIALSRALFERSTRRPTRAVSVPPGKGRVLMYHPESDSLFEGDQFDPGDGMNEDVSGIASFEERFEMMNGGSAIAGAEIAKVEDWEADLG